MHRAVKFVLIGSAGVAGLGIASLAGLVALGWYLQSSGLVPPQAAASQASPSPTVTAQPAPVPPSTAMATAAAPSQPVTPAVTSSPASPSTGIVDQLEALEAQSEFAQLGADIFNNAATMTPQQRKEVRAWLEAREGWGRTPVLFLLSRIHEADGDLAKAAEYYAAAGIAYRIDADCVIDRTGRGAVGILEEHMPRVRQHISKTQGEMVRVVQWGLAKEEAMKDREPAAWIVAHGLVNIGSELAKSDLHLPGMKPQPADQSPYVDAAQREQIRAEIRASFEKVIERNRDK